MSYPTRPSGVGHESSVKISQFSARSNVIVNFVIVFPVQDSETCARTRPGPSIALKRTRFDELDTRSKKFGMPVIPSHASNPATISAVAPDRTSEGALEAST